MYIRKASRTYKGKTYSNYLLVESILTPKGPRQKIICSLGDLSPRPRPDWLALAHKLESALCGQPELAGAAGDAELDGLLAKVRSSASAPPRHLPAAAGDERVAVRVEGVRCEESREAGPVHVGCQFWRRLQLDTILAQAGLSEGARRLSLAMTLNRLIHPTSELAMPEWIRTTALPDILGVDFHELAEDALYRNLDQLHEHRVTIEAALADRERNLFGLDQTVFLYDVTSTYFEGRAMGNAKAKRGYSRDHRGDCKQVLVGLAVNRDGFPLAHEVFAGNRHDSTTLEEMLKALDRRVGLRPEQTVVVDRGMAGKENVEQIRARGLHYLVAEPYAERKDWVAEFQDSDEFAAVEREPSPRNPFQKKSTIQVKMRRVGGETHVLCLSSERKEKDRAIRELHEKRLLADLEKLNKRVAKGKGKGTKPAEVRESIGRLKERYSRVARYYRMEYDETNRTFAYHLEESKRAEAEQLDGSYLLKTDREDLSAEEAWRIYILLTRAEAAFRALKSPLAERPIFHHKECRVEAHIFLCVLAYHLLTAIEKTLLDAGLHTSWATVREQLKTHQVNTIVLPAEGGMELRIRKATVPEPIHQELYKQLGIAPEIMRPQRSLAPAEEVPK
ncbi:MAG TPA: IS1634 family transposase [Bryobacteraceae bacterium]|nr:IS1634 family transposase [Bryobacteraceae bacterium]